MLKMLNPLYFLSLFKFSLDSGGGDSGGGPTTSTNYTTNLPEYAKPYYEDLMKRTQALSNQQYTPYSGPRVAGFTQDQLNLQQEIGNLQTPGQFADATGRMQDVGNLGLGAAGAGLNRALAYDPTATRTFGSAEAQQYMSPYQQAVTDIALREARKTGALNKQTSALASAGRGTFGGARQALLQAENDRNLGQTLGDIQAKGSQDAFMQAQRQFNTEEALRQQAGQFGASLGTQLFGQGMGSAQQAAAGLGALGSAQQQADIQRLGMQQQTAAQQQALQQNQMDIAYQDFLRQRDYPMEMLGFYNQMLRGLPVQLASTQQTYQAAPNLANQIAGLGIGALSLNKLLGSQEL